MTKDAVLLGLADADPARAIDPAPSEELLGRLLAEPRPPRSRWGRGRRIGLVVSPLVAFGAAAAVAILVLVGPFGSSHGGLSGSLSGGSLALAAQAYAQTTPAPGDIIHTFATFKETYGATPQTGSVEEWHRGNETHRIEKYYAPDGTLSDALDHVITADGVMYQVDGQGGLSHRPAHRQPGRGRRHRPAAERVRRGVPPPLRAR